jgi:hypothetical protein
MMQVLLLVAMCEWLVRMPVVHASGDPGHACWDVGWQPGHMQHCMAWHGYAGYDEGAGCAPRIACSVSEALDRCVPDSAAASLTARLIDSNAETAPYTLDTPRTTTAAQQAGF